MPARHPSANTLLLALAGVMASCAGAPDDQPAAGSGADSVAPEPALTAPTLPAPPLDSSVFSFAYVDSSGTQLLALSPLAAPTAVRGAICGAANALHVTHDRRQERGQEDTGRQVATNFAMEAGDVFRVQDGFAKPDETCLLTQDTTLLTALVERTALQLAACSARQTALLEVAASRKVVQCWRIEALGRRAETVAAQFATIDTSALAALAIVDDSVRLFHTFPANYAGPDADVWRVDDQGVFAPETLNTLFIARTVGTYVFAFSWAGSEGESSTFVVADGSRTTRELARAYRYWVPN